LIENLENQLVYSIDFIFRHYEDTLQNLSQRLLTIIHSHVLTQDREINALQLKLTNIAYRVLQEKKSILSVLHTQFEGHAAASLSHHKSHIARLEDKLHLLDPVNMLRRGYSITRADGKIVRNAKILQTGQLIETMLYDGKFESIVK